MSPDVATIDAHAPPRPAGTGGSVLRVLVISPTLETGHGVPAPVEFANALSAEGMSVMFAAAVGPLRPGLSRSVGYFLTDNADQAPVKTAHELSHLIRHHRPDVVHAHGARCALVTAVAIKASRLRCARVMTHHTRQLNRLPRWIKAPMLARCADRFVASSDALKAELESLGVPSTRILIEPVDAAHARTFARDSIAMYRDLLRPQEG
jgi:hypothetical protein